MTESLPVSYGGFQAEAIFKEDEHWHYQKAIS